MSEAASDAAEVWMCGICGFEYRQGEGWPEDHIPPGTSRADIPEDWRCPQCGAEKAKFEPEED